ncbi:DUF3613 domain-containing protein [Variovorax sp.]|jgi:hypothetical protein|uniref:DUF3613 domain-containing protein n=1 Tax=Variovorax sp. TaxID=1871043 RepID=UPI001222C889|nr:DUF3613 domain-containing protein [Variovorax sp.]TAJ57239.1 MAG: DUF3613 domain-containing protein [Variovorax sp.]
MNYRSIGEVTALSACALAAMLLLAPLTASAQPDAAKPDEAKPKSVTTVTVPDAPTAKAAEPAPTAAAAQEAQLAKPEEEDEYVPPLQVGDATLNLLAWQRSGEIASRTPRPITGSVAGRSYERYLKSFEFPIPERLNSTVSEKGGSSSSGGSR